MSTHDQSLKALWQNLPSETVTFTADQMRSRVRKFQVKHKRRDIIEYSSCALLFALLAYMLTLRSEWQEWVSSGLAVFAAIIMMWNYNRLAKVETLPTFDAADKTIKFLRRQLRRQRDAAASAWKWYVLPTAPFFVFTFAYRWIQEGSTILEFTDMRISLLIMLGCAISFLGATVLWMFLRAARYQRQLDDLERYVSK